MPPPYNFTFWQPADVTWTDGAGQQHSQQFSPGQASDPFDNPCDAMRFLNGTIDAGIPLRPSAEAIYQEVAEQCAATPEPPVPDAAPPEPAPQPDPSSSGGDVQPSGSEETPRTLNAPDVGPGFDVEGQPSPVADAPPAERYYAPNPAADYDILDQLVNDGVPIAELDQALQQVIHNEPPLGEPHPQFGQDNRDPPAMVADPVDLFSGSYTLAVTDVEIPSRSFPLRLTRVYRSGAVYFGPWGYGWDHSYNIYLRELNNGGVAIWRGSLSEDVFASGAPGSYESPAGIFCRLQRLTAGGILPDRWELSDREGRTEVFSRPNGWPLADRVPLTEIRDRHGNHHDLSFDSQGRLERVADQAGRYIEFRYGECGLLEQVVDHTGRIWRYIHDVDVEHLLAVTTPATDDYPDGITTHYRYDRDNGHPLLRHNLLQIVDQDRRTVVENEYGGEPGSDDFGRVVRQLFADFESAFEATRLQVVPRLPDAINVPALQVASVDPGVLRVHTFNYRGDLLDERFRLALDGTWRLHARIYRYDAQGNLIERREPNGLGARYTYDFANFDARARGNLLMVELLPPQTAAIASRIIQTITYEPQFHRPKTSRDEFGRITTWSYDYETGPAAFGDVIAIEYPSATLPDGSVQRRGESFRYDPEGALAEHVTGAGHVHRFSYGAGGSSNGLLTGITWDVNGAAQEETFEYDPWGRRGARIDGLGRRTATPRNALGQITKVQLPVTAGVTDEIVFTYSCDGRVCREHLPRGAYDDDTISDPFIANEYDYDVLGHLTAAHYGVNTAAPRTITFDHDAEGRVREVIDAIGRRTTFDYDERGALLRRTGTAGSLTAAVWAQEYDRNGNVVTFTDPAGHRFNYDYDAWDRLTVMTLPGAPDTERTHIALTLDEADRVTQLQITGRDGHGNVATLAQRQTDYDERGRAWRQRQGARVLDITYDADERPVAQVDQRGSILTFAHDGLNRVVHAVDALGNETRRTYDAAGQLTLIEEQEQIPGGGMEILTTTLIYDARARPIAATDSLGRRTNYEYDSRDLATRVIDPLGRVIERGFDLLGDVSFVTSYIAAGSPATHRFAYDTAQRNTAYTNPDGQTTTYSYDERDRRTAITYPDGRTHIFVYGHALQPASEQTPSGTVVTYSYGADAALTKCQFAPSPGVMQTPDILLEYDGLRRATRLAQGAVDVRRSFDDLLRLVSETTNGETVAVSYEEAVGTATLTYPDGRRDLVSFDPLGRVATVTFENPGGTGLTGPLAAGTQLAAYTYRGTHRVAERTLCNGITTAFEYDAATRLTAILHRDAAGASLSTVRYIHDAGDDQRVVWCSPAPQKPVRFGYDGLARLVNADLDMEALPEPSPSPSQAVADAEIAAAAAVPAGLRGESYTLNASDARLADARRGPVVSLADDYTLTASGQIAELQRTGSSAGTWLFTFDGDGRCTEDDRFTYSYDALSRLVAIKDRLSGSDVMTQTFDAAGRVVVRTLGTRTMTRAHFGLRVIEERDGTGNPARQFAYGLATDEILLQCDTANYVALQDLPGSVLAITDDAGSVVERYRYWPFGEVEVFAPDGITQRPRPIVASGPRFAGHVLLLDALYDARARVYDAKTGRFLQPDPLGYADSPSLYAYAHHDPVAHIDPTGEIGWLIGLAIVAGIGFVAGAGMNAAHQGLEIHEGSREEFSLREMLGMGASGAVAAPLLTFAPELAVPLAARGAATGIDEMAHKHWESGSFDLATSLLPFAFKGVRSATFGRGSVFGEAYGLGPSATAGARFGRFAEIGSTTRAMVSRAWNERLYHGTSRAIANAAVRDIQQHLRMVRVLQELPGTRELGPGLYFARDPGNPSLPGTPAWWAQEGGGTGRPSVSPEILQATVPRWRMALLQREPGVMVDAPQHNFPQAPQTFFPFEGPFNNPSGPAMRLGQLARWRIYSPDATAPNTNALWPTLLSPLARWPDSSEPSTARTTASAPPK